MVRRLLRSVLLILTIIFLNTVYSAQTFAGTVTIPEKVRVGIITTNSGSQYRNATSVTFTVRGKYELIDLSAIPGTGLVGTPQETETWQIFHLSSGIQLYKDGQPVKITKGPVVVRELNHNSSNQIFLKDYSVNGKINSIGRWYRADIEFRSLSSSLLAVNELPLDEYLCGVVPREMSNSWPLEALKAQAVAARTFIVANYNKRIVEGFNVLDSPNDQAYGGFSSEGARSTTAVHDTTGQIITYNEEPISAVYHSNSGGHTEDNENVWGGKPLDYLRGKEDPYSTKHGLANWSYSATTDQTRQKLLGAGLQLEEISSITLDKYRSGRVKTVIIKDVNGNTITRTGKQFGYLFNPGFYTSVNANSFMSNFFDIKTDVNSSQTYSVLDGSGKVTELSGGTVFGVSADGTIEMLNKGENTFYAAGNTEMTPINKTASGNVKFTGHGWGHGAGMSQWGAYEMAVQGKSYVEILNFYYSGVEISGTAN